MKREWFIGEPKYQGYDGSVSIEHTDDTCDCCKREMACLSIDTSGGEYATLLICRECANRAFDGTLEI